MKKILLRSLGILLWSSSAFAEVNRIIPLTPSLAELVCVFSEGPRKIVGVTEYTDFPALLNEKEKIGGYHHLNYERISVLKPDLLIGADGGNAPFEIEILKKQHPSLLILRENSFSDLLRNLEILGARLGARSQKEAQDLKLKWVQKKEEIVKRGQKRPLKTVLILVDENPLLVAGGPTYFTEILEWVGARNVFSDLAVKYPRISKEEALRRNPDVVITFGRELSPAFLKLFKNVTAVKQQQIYPLKDDAIVRPGPRMLEAAEILERSIYKLNPE
jgi:iron complex transport system substrate-binding protein